MKEIKDGTYHGYTPTPIFKDLFHVEIDRYEVSTAPFLLFFKRKVVKVTNLFSGPHGNASEFMKKHPEIKFDAHYTDFRDIKRI